MPPRLAAAALAAGLALAGPAAAAPDKLAPGQWPELRHITDRAPSAVARCEVSLSDITIRSSGFGLDVDCAGLAELYAARETNPGKPGAYSALMRALTDPAMILKPIKLATPAGTATGTLMVTADGKQEYGVEAQLRRKDGKTDYFLCVDDKPAAGRGKLCREALEALGRSTVFVRGPVAWPGE